MMKRKKPGAASLRLSDQQQQQPQRCSIRNPKNKPVLDISNSPGKVVAWQKRVRLKSQNSSNSASVKHTLVSVSTTSSGTATNTKVSPTLPFNRLFCLFYEFFIFCYYYYFTLFLSSTLAEPPAALHDPKHAKTTALQRVSIPQARFRVQRDGNPWNNCNNQRADHTPAQQRNAHQPQQIPPRSDVTCQMLATIAITPTPTLSKQQQWQLTIVPRCPNHTIPNWEP